MRDITYIDSTPITPEGWQELDSHAHLRDGRCVKNEDGPLCENDPGTLREERDALATWATQAVINFYHLARYPQGGVLLPDNIRETLEKFLHQAPQDVRLAAFDKLLEDGHEADRQEGLMGERCQTCHGSGWFGARNHDPAHYASHIHCVACGNPCKACEAGDGFKSPPPSDD